MAYWDIPAGSIAGFGPAMTEEKSAMQQVQGVREEIAFRALHRRWTGHWGFIGLFLLGLVLVVPPGCRGSKGGGDQDRKIPFDSWRDLRQALRSSPDHLAAQADRVVASGDPEVIFEFVRDTITARPVRADGFDTGEAIAVRWTPDVTLRYGVGTPREKVELLAELYRRAGFEAEVWVGQSALTEEETRACLAAKPLPSFDPSEEDLAKIDSLRRELGWGGTPAPIRIIDTDAQESKALADKLMALLPADVAAAKTVDLSEFDQLPFVRLVVAGQETFANPLPPDAEFGESYTTGSMDLAPDPVFVDDTIHVELAVARSDAPDKLVTIVSGDWSLQDLIGHRLRIQMLPAEDMETVAGSRLEDLRTFYAIIGLDGPGLEPDFIAEQAVVSDSAITLSGRQVVATDEGEVTVDGQPIASGPVDPDLLAKVASIEIEADPVRFPEVTIQATVKDADGNVVPGLGASAFRLTDEDQATGFIIEHGTSQAPRVVILLDNSESIPSTFREQAASYVFDLATSIRSHHPDAMFRVAAVGDGAEPQGPWTSSPEEARDQAAAGAGAFSDLWSALAGAGDLGGTVIVFTTDGEADDPPTQEERLRIAHGPPAVIVGVGTVVQATLDDMASLSHGTQTTATQPSQVAEATNDFLDAKAVVPYQLAYHEGSNQPGKHRVTLTTSDGKVVGTTTYDVPDTSDLLPTPALTGLYLKIEFGFDSVTRTIAGHDLVPGTQPTDEDLDDVQDAMFGTVLLSVEGSAPTLSALIDDAVVTKLSAEPLADAIESNDIDAIKAALNQPMPFFSVRLFGMATPLPQQDLEYPTFETGPRFVLLSQRPEFGKGIRRRIDILPFGGFATLNPDPKEAFRRTLEATARLAVTEAGLLPTSTMSLLADSELVLLDQYQDISSVAPGLDQETKDRWAHALDFFWDEYRIVPRSGRPVAFYTIDPDTGRVLAVLADGSGGATGTEDIDRMIDRVNRGAAMAGLAGGLAGAGFGFAGFVALQKAILKAILREAKAVAMIGEGSFDPDLGGIGKDFLCDLAKAGAGEWTSGWTQAVINGLGNADAATEAATGKGFLNCP